MCQKFIRSYFLLYIFACISEFGNIDLFHYFENIFIENKCALLKTVETLKVSPKYKICLLQCRRTLVE